MKKENKKMTNGAIYNKIEENTEKKDKKTIKAVIDSATVGTTVGMGVIGSATTSATATASTVVGASFLSGTAVTSGCVIGLPLLAAVPVFGLAALGAGAVGYGVYRLIKKDNKKRKEDKNSLFVEEINNIQNLEKSRLDYIIGIELICFANKNNIDIEMFTRDFYNFINLADAVNLYKETDNINFIEEFNNLTNTLTSDMISNTSNENSIKTLKNDLLKNYDDILNKLSENYELSEELKYVKSYYEN